MNDDKPAPSTPATPLSRGISLVARAIEAVAPASDGGPPLAMRYARTRFGWMVASGFGLGLGALVGLLVFLQWKALPDAPMVLLGLLAGLLVGIGLCVFAIARVTALRKKGRLTALLVPLAISAAPFLLVGVAWEAIWKRRRTRRHPET